MGFEAAARQALAGRHAERAATLLAAATALRSTSGAPRGPTTRERYERDLAAVHAAVGDQEFAVAQATGEALPLQEASALAKGAWSADVLPARQAT
jgi:hypothetical protein